METTGNPARIALIAGVGLGVLFALLGISGLLDVRIGLGLGIVSLLVALLVYLFYSRGTAVSKTGYGSLICILVIGLIIPFLTVNQQQAQAQTAKTQYDQTLQRGAALFGQYCASCHGYQGQGLAGPQLNGNADISKLTDDDLTRIISGGVPDPTDLTKYQMPAWLNTFGGPLTEEDITYLVALIRSTDNTYTKSKNLPSTNGFNYVLASLTNPQQIADFKSQQEQANAPKKPDAATFVDLTGKAAVTVDAINQPSGGKFEWAATGAKTVSGGQTANIIISVGTKVTWTNQTSVAHNVFSGYGKSLAWPGQTAPVRSPVFTQGQPGFSTTFDKAGEYPFYCGIHPYMIGWITVK